LSLEFYERFYFAATGIHRSLNELLQCSERIFNLTRAINIRRGLRAKDDTLPKRDFLDPIPSGRTKGTVLDRSKFRTMVKAYYRSRGWDENGVPTAEKLKQLGFVALALKKPTHGGVNSKVKFNLLQETSEVSK
jgi:aldehyde:ferredoxin oxidoreductase